MTSPEKNAAYWITNLDLHPHPEGGYFRESYRAGESIARHALPPRFSGDRSLSTAIYYLLEAGDFSAFHRIRSDETWHFYSGGPLDLHVLQNGSHQHLKIGSDIDQGQHLQWTVPAGAWFASRPAAGTEYVLAGCTVSPGFDFADFELARTDELSSEYPHLKLLIEDFTRQIP